MLIALAGLVFGLGRSGSGRLNAGLWAELLLALVLVGGVWLLGIG